MIFKDSEEMENGCYNVKRKQWNNKLVWSVSLNTGIAHRKRRLKEIHQNIDYDWFRVIISMYFPVFKFSTMTMNCLNNQGNRKKSMG